jgi:hypothetical protein
MLDCLYSQSFLSSISIFINHKKTEKKLKGISVSAQTKAEGSDDIDKTMGNSSIPNT